MDFDAIIYIKNILAGKKFSENDIMIITSFIMNGNVDLNLSIKEMITQVSNDYCDSQILNSNDSIMDLPLYLVLTFYPEFSKVLVSAVKKKKLNIHSYLNLIEELLKSVDALESLEESRIVMLILDLISAHGRANLDIIQDSVVLRSFVVNNLDSLNLQRGKRDLEDKLLKKMMIIKLLSKGFVSYGNAQDISINFQDILRPLLNGRNYSHARLVINSSVLDKSHFSSVITFLDEFLAHKCSDPLFTEKEELERFCQDIKDIGDLYGLVKSIRNM